MDVTVKFLPSRILQHVYKNSMPIYINVISVLFGYRDFDFYRIGSFVRSIICAFWTLSLTLNTSLNLMVELHEVVICCFYVSQE